MSDQTIMVLDEVAAERARQDAKWGDQRGHEDGTSAVNDSWRDHSRNLCNQAARENRLTWAHILQEEFTEAMAEVDPAALRAELIQVAAVAVVWIESIDRRTA